MELTSLGRAYLAGAPPARRKALLAHFKRRRGAQWPALAAELQQAMEQVESEGYCAAAWQPEVVALATNLAGSRMPLVVNVSVSTGEPLARVVRELAPVLLQLAGRISRQLQQAHITSP